MVRRKEVQETYLQSVFHARELHDKGVSLTDPDFEAKYPILWSLLNDNHVSEDKVGETAYLRVQNSAGDWSFSVGSSAVGGSCEVMVATFPEGLPALEAKLAKGPEVWRFWPKAKPKFKQNGKAEKDA